MNDKDLYNPFPFKQWPVAAALAILAFIIFEIETSSQGTIVNWKFHVVIIGWSLGFWFLGFVSRK